MRCIKYLESLEIWNLDQVPCCIKSPSVLNNRPNGNSAKAKYLWI
jgi:hypothetical protein